MRKILILDRDRKIMRATIAQLVAANEDIIEIGDLDDAERLAADRTFDAVLIGRLPRDVSRADACARIRRGSGTRKALLLVSVPRSAPRTRVRCFEEGADAVLDEPVSTDVVVTMLGARRRAEDPGRPMLAFGDLVMRPEERRVSARGLPLTLSPSAYGLLRVFLENPGKILSRRELVDRLGSAGIRSSRTVDSLVRRVRAAMAEVGQPDPIVAVPHMGYSLGAPIRV